MIDIHHHLLPGLDDGSPNMETSLKMIEMASADGITHIVCTPHANGRYAYDRARNQALLEELQQKSGNKVTLGLGCDFHMSYDNIQDALDNPTRYAINGRAYLLVEFPDASIPDSTNDNLYELAVAKQIPIVTHPERNPVLQRHPEKLAAWVRDGALVQVTASSLTGRFGRTAQTMAEKFLKQNWVHFLATDAHNPESRPPIMSTGYDYVKKHYGAEYADRICIENPRAVFEGKLMPPQPEASGLYDYFDPEENRRHGGHGKPPGLFKRMFGLG